MATFVVAHGAWSAGWVWKKMHARLRAHGHELVAPTMTGVGERSHLGGPEVDVDFHVRDIMAVLHHHDLRDIILIGHSSGGMVATGVANRMAERIKQLVYLDAFVPRDGESVFDYMPEDFRQRMLDGVAAGDGWRAVPNPIPPDTSDEDRAWILARRGPHPIGTQTQKISLDASVPWPPRSYIFCTRTGPGDLFRTFAKRAQADSAWRYFEIDASHSPHVTAPDELTRILVEIAG